MRKSISSFLLLVLLTLVGASSQLAAQALIAPVFPELFASPSPEIQVSHTGNSVVPFGSDPFRVSVWDGQTPGFHFDFGNGSVTGEYLLQTSGYSVPDIPHNPDVVIDPSPSGYFIIVYEWGGPIFYEVWRFNGVVCTPVVSPTPLSAGPDLCLSPNVDQTDERAGVVWEQNNRILGRTIEWGSWAVTPEIEFGACLAGDNVQPDIALYSNGIQEFAHVTYLNEIPGASQLTYTRHDLNDFVAGISPACAFPEFQILNAYPSTDAIPFAPRIAAPEYNSLPHDPRDCHIVLTEFYPGAQSHVTGYNHRATAWGINNFNYQTYSDVAGGDLVDCRNIRPAVSYTACEQIMIEWRYGIWWSGACLPLTSDQIIGRRLNMNGIPTNTDYLRVSQVLPGQDYSAVSVAGRFMSTFGPNLSTYSTYTETNDAEMHHKYSDCDNPAMKQGTESVKAAVRTYPNPFQDALYIATGDRPVRKIDVADLSGRTIYQWEAGTAPVTQTTWLAPQLPEGIYLLRLELDGEVITRKVVKGY